MNFKSFSNACQRCGEKYSNISPHHFPIKDDLKIIPVNEPNGEGNGWDECPEHIATAFEVDNGAEVVECFNTRSDAVDFIEKQKGS